MYIRHDYYPAVYNRFHQSDRELTLFSLQGAENKEYVETRRNR